MSLAISRASASSSKVVTATTGPKISSWKIRIELSPLKTVGCHVVAAGQVAVEDVRSPPVSTSAPSSLPMSM